MLDPKGEEIYQVIADNTQEGVWFICKDSHTQYVNSRMAAMLGYTVAEMKGTPLRDYVFESDQELLAEKLENGKRGVKHQYDCRYRRKNGTALWTIIVTTPLFDVDGNYTGAVGQHIDISERKLREEELAEKSQRFQMVMDFFNIGTFETDLQTKKLTWSDSLRKIYGVDSSVEATSEKFISLVHPEDRAPMEAGLSKLKTDGVPLEIFFRILRPDGHIRWLHCVGQRFFRGGKPSFISGMNVDITHQKMLQEDLDAQRSKMLVSSKLSAIGEMAGGIAHEINNPIAIIHARAVELGELAQEAQLDPKRVFTLAEKIQATALRISKIVKSLRSFAHDGERDPFQPILVALILEETLELCREQFRYHGVKLLYDETSFSGKLEIDCQRVQISQLLLNLLKNSHDAIDGLKERWIKLEVKDEGDEVSISVTDSGSGVPAHLHEKIFQPFFTTKEVGKGTGLGLSVSKGIADIHHGRIQIDSSSKNTRFLVLLPKRQSAPTV